MWRVPPPPPRARPAAGRQWIPPRVAQQVSGDNAAELLRLYNAPGGIDENGEPIVAPFSETGSPVATTAGVLPDNDCEIVSYSFNSIVGGGGSTCTPTETPSTPLSSPGIYGSPYKPINIGYFLTMPTVVGASYYQLYEVGNQVS